MSLETAVTSDSNGRLANHMQQQQFVLRIQKREGSQKYICGKNNNNIKKTNQTNNNDNNNKKNAYKSFAPLTTIETPGTGYTVSLTDTIINELSTNANIIILL